MNAPRVRLRAAGISVLAVVSLGLAACSSSDDDSDPPESSSGSASGTLRVGIEDYPTSWEPGVDNGYAWIRVPYETLVSRSPDGGGVLDPQLATEWEQADDTITFKLREGVTFQDGTTFDAEAAKFNLEYARDQGGPFSAGLQVIASIDTPDANTLVLNLSAPSQGLLTTLSGRAGVMASPQAMEDGTIKDHPVGTGPWAYNPDLSTPGTEVGFTLREDYWDLENVGVENLVLVSIDDPDARLNALMTGEIDLGDVNLAQADQAREGGLELATFPGVHYSVIFFDRGPGGAVEDPEVRHAICDSIDTEGLAALGGSDFLTAANQRFQEGDYGHSAEIPPLNYDPDGAAPVLQGTAPLSMMAFAENQPFAEAIAGGLDEVGVELNVDVVPAAKYFTGWYDGSYSIGFGDNSELTPEEWYKTWFAADAPNNPAGAESPELAAAAAAAMAESDPAAAEPLWVDVVTQIAEESLLCNNTLVNQGIGWLPGKVDGVTTVDWEASSVVFKNLTVGS